MVQRYQIPIIPRTAAQKKKLENLRIKLTLYRWDANDDMMTHIIKVKPNDTIYHLERFRDARVCDGWSLQMHYS